MNYGHQHGMMQSVFLCDRSGGNYDVADVAEGTVVMLMTMETA